MKIYLITAAGVLLGMVVGSAVNMGLIIIGPAIIATPQGFDNTSQESMLATVHLLEARHFVFPFLAHALGTLTAALIAGLIASHRLVAAIVAGSLSLLGGVINAILIPAPVWFEIVDLVFAYVPMIWLGYWLATKLKPVTNP